MGGFSIVPLAQKARTQTLIVDSDLNLGNYDLLCTDAKGDTAEFDEFVGGVGNFTNVLGSGNLDIEGAASIKGNTQIDGNIVLEGAINNVNIADNGEITTAQGVNGADFNGATITANTFNGATITANTFNGVPIKTVVTVTPTNAPTGEKNSAAYNMDILPHILGVVYSGIVRIQNMGSGDYKYEYSTNGYSFQALTLAGGATYDINLSNASCLHVYARKGFLGVYGLSLS